MSNRPLYLCDPDKNLACKKTNCRYTHALGECRATLDPAMARQDSTGRPIRLPDKRYMDAPENTIMLPKTGYDARLCPMCGGETRIGNMRIHADGYAVRYRKCTQCPYRYGTVELEYQLATPQLLHRRKLIIVTRGENGGPGAVDWIKEGGRLR